MSEADNLRSEPDPLNFATLCAILGFIAGMGLGLAALATDPKETGAVRNGR